VGVGWGGQGQRYGRNGCARECASTLQPLGLLRVCSGFISRVKTDGVPHMFVMTVLFALCQLAPTPAMCCHPVCCRQPQAILGVHPTWQRTVMFEFPRIRFQHTPVTKTQQRALLEAGGGGRGGGGRDEGTQRGVVWAAVQLHRVPLAWHAFVWSCDVVSGPALTSVMQLELTRFVCMQERCHSRVTRFQAFAVTN
jgi:hypothetical protein